MSMLASELIEDAILLASPHIAEHQMARGPLLRALTGLDFDVMRQVALYAPELLSVEGAIASVEPTLNLTGYPLSNGVRFGAFNYIADNGKATPISIVPEDRFETTRRHPAGIVRLGGNQAEFFPADPLGRRWEGDDNRSFFSDTNEQISYRFVPGPLRITAVSQALQAPEEARDYLQWSLTAYLLESGSSAPPEDRVASARSSAALARQEFVRNLMTRVPIQSSAGEPLTSPTLSISDWVTSV